ncbi:hypothetical protein SUGI_1142720 [Cryptomeria japonica]|nr:hypothetical protein SUGI_1142720 [Cryptomeria japonica]
MYHYSIRTLCRESRLEEAMSILRDLDKGRSPVDSNMYSCLLQASTIAKSLTEEDRGLPGQVYIPPRSQGVRKLGLSFPR